MSVLSNWWDTSSQLFWYKPVFMIELMFAETYFVLLLGNKVRQQGGDRLGFVHGNRDQVASIRVVEGSAVRV